LTFTPSQTASFTPTYTQTASLTYTPSQTSSLTPTATSTSTKTNTFTPSATGSPTFTPTRTLTPTATATNTPGSSVCSLIHNGAFENQVLTLINDERTLAGLGALTDFYPIENSAGIHSDDQAANNFLSHTGSDGSTYWQREVAAGDTSRWGGEIIHAGLGAYNNPQSAMNWWMNDAPHEAIMLADYNDFGAGYAYCPTGTYGGFFTADFGHR
jgi:uncharacterized protein YkwD